MIFSGRKVLIFHGFKCCLNMYKSVELEAAVCAVIGSLWNTLVRLCILRWSCWLQKGTTPSPPSWAEFGFHRLLLNSGGAAIKYLQIWLSSCHSGHSLQWFSFLRRPGLNAGFLLLVGSFLFLAWWYFWKLNISSSIMLLETYSHLVHSSGSEMAIKENGSFETLMLWNKWCARTEI